MSFSKFNSEDIVDTEIITYPSYKVVLNGNAVTGSVYLEKKFLDSTLLTRRFQGYSERLGGFLQYNSPFTASIDTLTAVSGRN